MTLADQSATAAPEAALSGGAFPPVFPPADVLDGVLYDYLRRADRMGWSPYDLVLGDGLERLARPDRLSDVQRDAVKTVLFVEDHLPGYLSEYLRVMTDPDQPDEQYAVNRRALHYTFRWVAEEDRHAHVLELYLTGTGLVPRDELEREMARERKTAYAFPYTEMEPAFIYLALQEKATHLYYRALAGAVEEPLLKSVLRRMAADEASHGKFFYDLLIRSNRGDLDALSRKISGVASDFKMPVQSNLLNYRRQILNLMRAAPAYRHPDVLADMLKAVEDASRQSGRPEAVALIAPDDDDDDAAE